MGQVPIHVSEPATKLAEVKYITKVRHFKANNLVYINHSQSGVSELHLLVSGGLGVVLVGCQDRLGRS